MCQHFLRSQHNNQTQITSSQHQQSNPYNTSYKLFEDHNINNQTKHIKHKAPNYKSKIDPIKKKQQQQQQLRPKCDPTRSQLKYISTQ